MAGYVEPDKSRLNTLLTLFRAGGVDAVRKYLAVKEEERKQRMRDRMKSWISPGLTKVHGD